jgi:glycogen debranching enzyme
MFFQAIRSALLGYFLPQVKIPELYMLDVGSLVSDFCSIACNRLPPVAGTTQETGQLKIIPDKQYRRLKATVDMELALRLYNVCRYCT